MADSLAQLIPEAHLREIFEYRDGALYWKFDPRRRPQWNGQFAGARAGYQEKNGYRAVYFNASERNGLKKSRPIAAHRLIFCFHHGYYPPQVDHINGDRGDDRIENLRAALAYQNAANIERAGPTGCPGVRRRQDGRYEVRVSFAKKRHQIGSFTTLEDARAAAIAASMAIKGVWNRKQEVRANG